MSTAETFDEADAEYAVKLVRGYWKPGLGIGADFIYRRQKGLKHLPVFGCINLRHGDSPWSVLYDATVGQDCETFETIAEAKAWVECRVSALAQAMP